MTVRVETEKGIVLAAAVQRADTFLKRLKGWMFRGEPREDEGLLLEPCNSIHTCFMRFSIDVLFLSDDNRVLARYDRLTRNRMIPRVSGAVRVLELAAGRLSSLSEVVNIGDTIKILPSQ